MSIESPLSPSLLDARAEADAPSVNESRVRIIIAAGLIVVAVMLLVARLLHPFDFIGDESYGWFLDRLLPRLRGEVGSWSVAMMLFYPLGILGIFMLERRYPAIPSQKVLSNGVVHDAFWMLVKGAARVMIVSVYGSLLYRLYDQYLSFLTLSVAESIPAAVRVVMGFLVADFAQWCQHVLHHNVKWLWPFHAVHHSQRELNMFSDYRVHFMEYLVRRPVTLLPMLILGLQEPTVMWWLLILSWETKLQHANIRSNFGWLRYIIVTPQSHRVHHSLRAEHTNHNYGSILSIWDYLFGTQVRDYDTYPETGIDDETFPRESARSVWGVLSTIFRQLLYPFRRLWTLWRG